MSIRPSFWNNYDNQSMARSLRLAVAANQLDIGNLSRDDAIETLRGALTPGDPSTIIDDSEWIDWRPEICMAPAGLERVAVMVNNLLEKYK